MQREIKGKDVRMDGHECKARKGREKARDVPFWRVICGLCALGAKRRRNKSFSVRESDASLENEV
jgi:hypothetical protein